MEFKYVTTRTPLRISFFGGGTDFKNFYKDFSGKVISTTINKYIYVTVKTQNFFYEKYRLNYSSTERVNNINKIQNKIIRACLKYTKVKNKLYISTVSDIPDSTGLGSSSAFTVGLLKALYKIKGIQKNNQELAKIATIIEIKMLRSPIGIQDQYSCAVGGFNEISFLSNNTVKIVKLDKYLSIKKILKNSLLVWTGNYKKSNLILRDQNKNVKRNTKFLKEMLETTNSISLKIKRKDMSYKDFIFTLKQLWELKKKLSNKITNKNIERIIKSFYQYDLGFKVLGAGGGGFIFVYGKKCKEILIKEKYQTIDVSNSDTGSKIIYEE